MGTLHLLFNAVTVIFIAAIMFTAGLGATVAALRGVLTDVPLLTLSLIANMVAIPLLGWGIGVLFGLPTTSFIALVLVASSPGGPFGAKPAMVQKKRRRRSRGPCRCCLPPSAASPSPRPSTASSPPPRSAKASPSTWGRWYRLWHSCKLVPFVIGLLLRRYAALSAQARHPTAAAVSNVTFLIVLAGMLVGNRRDVVALLGSLTLLAGFVPAAAAFAVGTSVLPSHGPAGVSGWSTVPSGRTTTGAGWSARAIVQVSVSGSYTAYTQPT